MLAISGRTRPKKYVRRNVPAMVVLFDQMKAVSVPRTQLCALPIGSRLNVAELTPAALAKIALATGKRCEHGRVRRGAQSVVR